MVIAALALAASAGAQPDRVGAVEAIPIATNARPGKVFDLDLDLRRGRLVWDLDVASAGREFEIRVDARSGKVLRVSRDRTPDPEIALLRSAKVGASKAARTSARAVRGGSTTALELERERGTVVWDAEVTTSGGVEYDVIVHARTGDVLSRRVDD